MSEENKEKQKSLPVTDFYDLVIKIDSFRNLKKKEQGDYGWDILYSKDFDYDKRTKEERVKIGVSLMMIMLMRTKIHLKI